MGVKRMDCAKILTIVVTVLFVGVTIFACVVWAIDNRAPTEIMNIIAAPFTVIMSTYFVKTGAENYIRLKMNQQHQQKDSEKNR